VRKSYCGVTAWIPILNRKKHYENFARVLWHGYKDLWPTVAGLLGYNIGFVFQREANFKQGLKSLVAQNQSQLLLDVSEFLVRHPHTPAWIDSSCRNTIAIYSPEQE
jgi:hypothetical protein